MTAEYVGTIVNITLSSGNSVQGRVSKITSSTVSLSDVANNQSCVELFSSEISDIDIVSFPREGSNQQTNNDDRVEPITIMRRSDHVRENGNSPHQSPPRVDNRNSIGSRNSIGNDSRKHYKKQDAFSISTMNMASDFDFQSSNKLFKKDAIFGEWRQQDGVTGPKSTRGHKQEEKLKPTEMVIERSPPQSRTSFQGDFETDEKISVVGLTLSRRISLFKRAIGSGLSYSHVVSVAGVAVAQMVIQVLGGSCRVNAQNHNKPPVVAVLVASGETGKVALTTALHLHQHSLNVKVLVNALPKGCEGVLNILSKEGCLVQSLLDFPNVLDIVVDGIQDRSTLLSWPPWMDGLVDWAEQCSAPVLVVDPQHPAQMPRNPPPAKWACALGAPLVSQGKEGRLFLVDIGLFSRAFSQEDIPYHSPFFDKFIIPLHRVSGVT